MILRFRNNLGFSLVETMVATFIFALVSASGVMILSGYQEGRLSLAAADERLSELEILRATLSADLLQVLDRPVRDAMGGRAHGFEGGDYLPDGALLRFVRGGQMASLLATDRTALERVEYILVEDTLVRRSFARTDITPDTPVRDRVLMPGVRAVSLRFETDGQWVPNWQNTARPDLVEMTLELASGRHLSLTLMVGARA